jgi:NAD(P)-dependent dehydrogenase (short-subunit alcohol dehydrogenase family)
MSDALSDTVVIVTGASRGIGEAIAKRFALAGARVAVSARTVYEGDHPLLAGSITGTVRTIADSGGRAIAVPADLARAEHRARLVETVARELGQIDVLVNNAAVTYFEPVAEFKERHFQLMFEVLVTAPFDLAQRVLPTMRARRRGWILNISSGAARHPQGPPYTARAGSVVYGMCKAALERFSTGLAAEVYGHGIAVNALSPSGLVPTPGVLHHGLQHGVPPERLEPPEVMAEAAHALCTGDPARLTGRITYARPLLEELGISLAVR